MRRLYSAREIAARNKRTVDAIEPVRLRSRGRRTKMKLRTLLLGGVLLLSFATEALCDGDTWILATGRRDPRMYAIDLEKALRPENNNTPNAIVSRSKVALDRLDGKFLGDSANIVISEDRKRAYVVNHHGAIENDEFLQHGGRGNIAVMKIRRMIDPRHDN